MQIKNLHEIPHYQQKYTWDCGLSCIAMVLNPQDRTHFLENFKTICQDENITSGTWTIDLCYILQRFPVKQNFCSRNLSVDMNYANEPFYSKIIQQDAERILRKIKFAPEKGIDVQQRSVTLNEIVEHLDENGPIIILVNAHVLHCIVCSPCRTSCYSALQKILNYSPPYQGHYVVLCGYNLEDETVLYRDPSKSDEICVAKFRSLEEARKAYGTDEDIIFLYNSTK